MPEKVESSTSYTGSFPIKIILPVDIKKEGEEDKDAEVNSGEA